MRPRTAQPVAGAPAWALARWATLREAQAACPKQPDLITAGRDWSLLPHTHACDHQRNRCSYTLLSQMCEFWRFGLYKIKASISEITCGGWSHFSRILQKGVFFGVTLRFGNDAAYKRSQEADSSLSAAPHSF